MLVLVLLAVVMALAVPAFQNLLGGTVAQEINRLTGVIRLIRNEAVLTRRPCRLMIDLKNGKSTVEEKNVFGKYEERDEPKVLRPHRLPRSMVLKEIVVFGNRFGRQRDRTVAVTVSAFGFVDPFLLHFTQDGEAWTLKVTGLTGRMKLEPGNVEFTDKDLR